jgi:hypothetical protein
MIQKKLEAGIELDLYSLALSFYCTCCYQQGFPNYSKQEEPWDEKGGRSQPGWW